MPQEFEPTGEDIQSARDFAKEVSPAAVEMFEAEEDDVRQESEEV